MLYSILYSDSSELRQITKSLVKMKSWIIDFEEEIFGSTGIISRKVGKIYFARPLNFKIEYSDSAILSDGKYIYFIFDKKKKAYVKNLEEKVSQALIIEILAGSDSILNFFTINNLKQNIFELKPKENSIKDVDKLIIYSQSIGFPISQVEILSANDLGVRFKVTKVQFKDVRINFSLPEGFEIIDERKRQ